MVAALSCLLLCSTLSGCVSASGSASQCGYDFPSVEPSRAAPGETFVLRGWGFGGGCDDSDLSSRPERPQRNIPIEMRQDGKTWDLIRVDAGGGPDYPIKATLEVPRNADPGKAAIVVPDPGGAAPLKVPLQVLNE